MITNYHNNLLREALEAVRGILALEGPVTDGIIVEGTFERTTLMKHTPTEGPSDSKDVVQKVGDTWRDRILSARRKTLTRTDPWFPQSCYLDEGDEAKVSYNLFLSPFDVVYWLEHAAANQDFQWTVSANSLRLVSDGPGAIPIGAELAEDGFGKLYMVGSETYDGRPVHPLTIGLSLESRSLLDSQPDGNWILKASYGKVIIIEPTKREQSDD